MNQLSPIQRPKIHAETNKFPNCVQLQARGKGRSRRVLHFEHIRIWACQITQRDGSGMNQTTGEGNEHAAYLSHERILDSKQTHHIKHDVEHYLFLKVTITLSQAKKHPPKRSRQKIN